jgi:hypothetical protein
MLAEGSARHEARWKQVPLRAEHVEKSKRWRAPMVAREKPSRSIILIRTVFPHLMHLPMLYLGTGVEGVRESGTWLLKVDVRPCDSLYGCSLTFGKLVEYCYSMRVMQKVKIRGNVPVWTTSRGVLREGVEWMHTVLDVDSNEATITEGQMETRSTSQV